MRTFELATILALALAGDPAQISWPTRGWPTAAPAERGLDPGKLDALVKSIDAGKYGEVRSLLIVKDGALVIEHYFRGYDRETLHTIQSVTKSVSSLLIGAAMEQGSIENCDVKMLELFASYEPIANRDERKQAITLAHLLTMTAGFDWDESSIPYTDARNPLIKLNRSEGDWMRIVIDWPMKQAPGESFRYNSGISLLLSGILLETTGMHAGKFAEEALFQPLGITSYDWYSHPATGHQHTGGGLSLRPVDLAKIGYLMLQDGVWEGTRLLPEDWVERSTTCHVREAEVIGKHHVGYGYQWWLLPMREGAAPSGGRDAIWAGLGFGGQYLFVVPSCAMIIVSNAWNIDATRAYPSAIDFLYSSILPALR